MDGLIIIPFFFPFSISFGSEDYKSICDNFLKIDTNMLFNIIIKFGPILQIISFMLWGEKMVLYIFL